MKSAYELALERMENQGIERPDAGSLTDDDRAAMAEVRSRAEAKLAELEILYQQRITKLTNVVERQQEDDEYRIDRKRIESQRDDKLTAIRQR